MGGFSELDIALRNKYQDGIDEDAIDPATAAGLLGGEIEGKWIRCPSPGCDADDRSMYVKFNDGEPYIYDCDGSFGKAYKWVRATLGLAERPKRNTTDLAMRILYESRPAAGTLVERYLAARAITLPPPPCLKYHPLLKHPPTGRLFPAMVAERCDVYGAVVGVHCTFLKHDGSWKADVERPKLDFGPAKGNAIRLSPLSDGLMVGEGIETVMSVMQMTGRPAWAAGGHLRAVQLPKEVQCPLILADGDRPGEQKARAASARWTVEGRTVAIARPPWGKDFNDVLMEGGQ